MYDTEQAEEIARYAPNVDTGDFNYLIETLYKRYWETTSCMGTAVPQRNGQKSTVRGKCRTKKFDSSRMRRPLSGVKSEKLTGRISFKNSAT